MNKFKRLLILAAFATFNEGVSAQEPAPATPVTDTSAARDFFPERGLKFEFIDASLKQVLDHLSEAAGFVIQLKPGVDVQGKVTVSSAQPLNKTETVALLQQVLSDYGYAAVNNGRFLTIIHNADAPRGYSPVRLGNRPDEIPRNAEIVTQIIPVRHLNPVELIKVLRPLLPENVIPTVDESANAIIITDTQANIRRALEVITALDSVSASANTLRVFPLHFADAKSLASLVKELFATPDTSAGTGRGARANIPAFRFPGRGSVGTADGGDTGQTPITRVAAVADEYGNSLIVSAPDALIPAVEKLVESVDQPAEDIVEFRVFNLINSDPQEMADTLSRLFPDENNSPAAGRGAGTIQGQGGRGVGTPGARQGNNAGDVTSASGRMKKLGRVLAVPELRTSSLLVSAAKSVMPEIENIINRLDSIDAGHQRLHVIDLRFADGYEVQQILAALIPNSNTIALSSFGGTTDPLELRRTTMFNNFFTTGTGSTLGRSTSATTGGRGSN